MTVRGYLANAAPSYTPTAQKGTWNLATANIARKIGAKSGAIATSAASETSTATTGYRMLLATFVANIAKAGTISSSDSIAVRFGGLQNVTGSFTVASHMWVSAGSTQTLRGTILANYAGATGSPWSGTTPAFHGVSATSVGSNISAQAGDKVIIELGVIPCTTTATSRTATVYYGGTGADSVAVPGDPTTEVGWVDFTGGVESLLEPMTAFNPSRFFSFF